MSPFQQCSRAGRVLVRRVRVLVFIGAAGRTGSARRLGGGVELAGGPTVGLDARAETRRRALASNLSQTK